MSRTVVGGMVRGGAAGGGMLGVLLLAAALVLTPSRAQATSFPIAPGQRLVGGVSTYVTREEDTLADIARRNDLGYGQLVVVNRDIDPWLPGAGKRVTLPSLYLLPDAPRRGIVINLAEQRLYYFPPDGKSVETYPIGVGVEAGMTPLGVTRVVAKDVDPTWHPKTVRTLLARLVGKRALEYEVKGRTYVYSPLVTEQDCVTTVSESFLDRVFGGSLKPMLAHFVEKRKLTRQDLEELEQLLDGYSNSTKKTMKLGGKHEHGRH